MKFYGGRECKYELMKKKKQNSQLKLMKLFAHCLNGRW